MPNEKELKQEPSQVEGPKELAPKKSNLALIIILIAVLALAILGVGGYFAWKYFIKAKTTATADKTSNSKNELSLKTLETTFKYPGATVTSTDHSKASGEASIMVMESSDKMTVAYDYYLNLAVQKNLTVSKKSLDSDMIRATMTLQGTGYYVDIYLYQYDKTEIDVRIFGDNIKDDTAGTSSTETPTSATSTTTTTPTTSTAKDISSTDYVISDSNSRVIAASELTTLTPWQLKVARNEIYARHGRPFVHQDLQCYFKTKSWYQANPDYSDSSLTVIDNKNIATILAYEQKINSPILSQDTGC